VETDTGERIALPAGRLKPLARTLVDLFDSPSASLKLSRFDAPRLADALGDGWQGNGIDGLAAWLERIKGAAHLKPVAAPAGFTIELRPYQLEGLAWLQHLREHGLGGILADDMGLGKTAQALAHLLTEKHAGRLAKPALVVLPTSLVFNWQREAERFAPALKVLSLRGSSRAEAFAKIPEHDVCLTTYPLLWRDREQLAAHAYHSLILDEAQTVKNAASQAAQVVRTLQAEHRLCLTGTPLENHLGELWSQFDFLLPGFLGDSKDFTAAGAAPSRSAATWCAARSSPAASPPSSCAAARSRSPPSCRPRPSWCAASSSKAASATSTKPCAPPWTSASATRSPPAASRAARSSSSTPCSSCARCAATRASSRPTPPPR
jgi:hypothetical protein